MPVRRYFKGHGKQVMADMHARYGDRAEEVFRRTANKMGMTPRRQMSKGQRQMRDRSTRGSPPMGLPEIRQGYRSL